MSKMEVKLYSLGFDPVLIQEPADGIPHILEDLHADFHDIEDYRESIAAELDAVLPYSCKLPRRTHPRDPRISLVEPQFTVPTSAINELLDQGRLEWERLDVLCFKTEPLEEALDEQVERDTYVSKLRYGISHSEAERHAHTLAYNNIIFRIMDMFELKEIKSKKRHKIKLRQLERTCAPDKDSSALRTQKTLEEFCDDIQAVIEEVFGEIPELEVFDSHKDEDVAKKIYQVYKLLRMKGYNDADLSS